MDVSSIDTAQYALAQSAGRTTGSELGKDAFLSILVLQLQNQDPLNPMEDTDFIAQMAQFSSLEQMQALNSSFTANQATGMIGRYVYAEIVDGNSGEKEPVFGKVDGVSMINGKTYLHIGDSNVPVDKVMEVYSSESMEESDISQSLMQSSGLIGAYVTGHTVEDGETVMVEGIVGSLSVSDGTVYATIGEHKVAIADITGIRAV
jgi:flagellar basal-body rod modification protein FlgD